MPKTAAQRVQAAAEAAQREAARKEAAAEREANRKAALAARKVASDAAKNARKLAKAVGLAETAKLSRQRADSLLENQGKALNAGITQSVSAESLVGRVSGAVGERAQGELRQAARTRIAAAVAGVDDIATTNLAEAISNARRADKKAAMAASLVDPVALAATLTENRRAEERAREEAARAEANKFSFAKLFSRVGNFFSGLFSRKTKADVAVQNPAFLQTNQTGTKVVARPSHAAEQHHQITPSSTPKVGATNKTKGVSR